MSVTINGRSLAALVYGLNELDGHLAPRPVQRPTVALADSAGVWGTSVSVTPRTITVGLDARAASFADRATLMDTIARRLGGLLELETADMPGRVVRCVLSDVSVSFYAPSLALTACAVTLAFTALDPARIDTEPLVYGLSTARTTCPVGTTPSAPVVWIFGASPAVVDPVVIVRAQSGTEVSRLTFSVSLAATDALRIDTATQTIVRTVAGAEQTGISSGLATLSSGAFPLLSPEDGASDGTAAPTVELTSTSGTATGLILYTRRW